MYLKTTITWLRVSPSSASSGFLELFFSRESQYLASSSGDLLEDCAILVTALLLMTGRKPCLAHATNRRRC
uniref:Uncharacterized protein n=1 Tax=Anguilla anguilla TaxID=7936 RepID=A0A0E9RCJ8_ANGAN